MTPLPTRCQQLTPPLYFNLIIKAFFRLAFVSVTNYMFATALSATHRPVPLYTPTLNLPNLVPFYGEQLVSPSFPFFLSLPFYLTSPVAFSPVVTNISNYPITTSVLSVTSSLYTRNLPNFYGHLSIVDPISRHTPTIATKTPTPVLHRQVALLYIALLYCAPLHCIIALS